MTSESQNVNMIPQCRFVWICVMYLFNSRHALIENILVEAYPVGPHLSFALVRANLSVFIFHCRKRQTLFSNFEFLKNWAPLLGFLNFEIKTEIFFCFSTAPFWTVSKIFCRGLVEESCLKATSNVICNGPLKNDDSVKEAPGILPKLPWQSSLLKWGAGGKSSLFQCFVMFCNVL